MVERPEPKLGTCSADGELHQLDDEATSGAGDGHSHGVADPLPAGIGNAGEGEEDDDHHRIHAAAESIGDADPVLDFVGIDSLRPGRGRSIGVNPNRDHQARAGDGSRPNGAPHSKSRDPKLFSDGTETVRLLQQEEGEQATGAPEDHVPRRRFAAEKRKLIDA